MPHHVASLLLFGVILVLLPCVPWSARENAWPTLTKTLWIQAFRVHRLTGVPEVFSVSREFEHNFLRSIKRSTNRAARAVGSRAEKATVGIRPIYDPHSPPIYSAHPPPMIIFLRLRLIPFSQQPSRCRRAHWRKCRMRASQPDCRADCSAAQLGWTSRRPRKATNPIRPPLSGASEPGSGTGAAGV